MARAAGSPRHLHPALALLVALALHVGTGVGIRWTSQHSLSSRPLPRWHLFNVDMGVELSLDVDDLRVSPQAPLTALPTNAMAAARSMTSPTPHKTDVVEAAEAEAFTDTTMPPASLPGSAPPRVIDLGLNDGLRRAALLGGWVESPLRRVPPSDGGLSQGLAALDAERGLSRSSAAHHAAYQAARDFAPATGIGIFNVLADEQGVVLSVIFTGTPSDETKWQRVGEELHQLLKDRRMRVPPGAKGIAARLRIETGELAKGDRERFRSKRGTALGQAPIHPREIRDESSAAAWSPANATRRWA